MPDGPEGALVHAVTVFAETVATKFAAGAGEPEALLRGPFEVLMVSVGRSLGFDVVLSDEHLQASEGVKPDWSVTVDGAPATGLIELKKPGTGADTSTFRGRNRTQWERLAGFPNLLYSDGNQWALYRFGARIGDVCLLDGDVRQGPAAPQDAEALHLLLRQFLAWEPAPPSSIPQLADITARLCRLLRDEVTDAMTGGSDALDQLADTWRRLLFPGKTDEEFADQYAQTVTFGLLLARAEGVELHNVELHTIARKLGHEHALLGRALEALTDEALVADLATSLPAMRRVLAVVDWQQLVATGSKTRTGRVTSPWLHFYEDFLSVYDNNLRQETGSYYTPDEVVACMVRLVDAAVRDYLHRPLGLAHPEVVVVDPCMGTGTYLLELVDTVARITTADAGEGAVPGAIEGLAGRLIGFEKQTGPYSVAQLRLAQTVREKQAGLAVGDLRLFVTDTLDDPTVEQTSLGPFYEPLAQSNRAANDVKNNERVLVVLGNPPYKNRSKGEGGWVENGSENVQGGPLLDSFLPSDEHAPTGNQTQELRNLYVYFWRWAIWKAFEAHPDAPDGAVAFITSSAWLTKDGFIGMREHLRGLCDHLWVIDLGGEGRGGRKEDNIFVIKTPVAIVLAVRDSRSTTTPTVAYRRVHGTAAEKLAALGGIERLDGDGWVDVSSAHHEPISAATSDRWRSYPRLLDLLPWKARGIAPSRTWVYSPDVDTLQTRWNRLVSECDPTVRAALFKPSSPHSLFDRDYSPLPGHPHQGPISKEAGACPAPIRVTFQSFDRQWLIPDRRLIHSPSPNQFWLNTDAQLFIGHNHVDPGGYGPAITFSAHPTNQGHFNGRNDTTILLWRDIDSTSPNVADGLLELLSDVYGTPVSPVDLAAYIGAVAAHGDYSSRFWDELELPGLRIPLTADAGLFHEAALVGREIIWLHTYGLRCADDQAERPKGHIRVKDGTGPKVTVPIPTTPGAVPEEIFYDRDTATLQVGDGRITPVSPAVWDYEVADLRVVESWFSYRRRRPAHKWSSPLNDIVPNRWPQHYTSELLTLLHSLERLVALGPQQQEILDGILAAPTLDIDRLTNAGVLPVKEAARRPPKRSTPDLAAPRLEI